MHRILLVYNPIIIIIIINIKFYEVHTKDSM